jgi:hypothetical protein
MARICPKAFIFSRYVWIARSGRSIDVVIEPSRSPRYHDARGQPLHIPFEGAGQRLVEIVDIEQQCPLGRGEQAEIREMRVTAQLDRDPRIRARRQVGRHRQRSSTVERER